jgi:HlyD family secretion protein
MELIKKYKYHIVAVLLIGFGLVYYFGKNAIESKLTAKVRKGELKVIVTSSGELKATNSTEIMAPSGLREIGIWNIKISDLITEGTTVKEGDEVAELDKTEVMNKINEERLNLDKKYSEYDQAKLDTTLTLRDARTELENLKFEADEALIKKSQNIYEAPSIQRESDLAYEKAIRGYNQKLDNYKTKVAQSITKLKIIYSDLQKVENKLKQLMDILGELNIKAPKDGMVIYSRDWEGNKKIVGSMISPWNPTVAELPDLRKMETITYINEVDIQKIKTNQKVLVGFDAIPGKKMNGIITNVASIGEQKPNSDAKVFEVKINILESDTTLRPGMTTANEIITQIIENALILPIEAVFGNDILKYVFKNDSGKTVKKEVSVGAQNENEIQILKGLNENDEVYLNAPSDTLNIPFIKLN